VLCGWVSTVRDHGGLLFADLRDRYGITQVVFSPANAACTSARRRCGASSSSPSAARSSRARKACRNPKLATGAIELHAADMDILNKAETPPFENDAADVGDGDAVESTATLTCAAPTCSAT